LIRSKSLSSDITAAGLAILGGLLALASWHLEIVPATIPGFTIQPGEHLVPPTLRVAAFGLTGFSLVVGLAIQRFGARRSWPYIAASFPVVILVCLLASRFLGRELLLVPLLFGGCLSAFLVQVNRLWQLERRLSLILLRSRPDFHHLGGTEATARLASGLKLLNTVLPLNEAIVFQCLESGSFQTVARLKGSPGIQPDVGRISLWRDGVRLCERAVKTGALEITTADDRRSSNVAVPLRDLRETVGVLLVRLNSEFCDDDKPLLEAVGSQFTRNLKRENLSKNPARHHFFSYFSQTGSLKKLDAVYVQKALLTEQRCEANALSRIDDGVAIAYLDGTLALANSTLLSFGGLTPEQATGLDLFRLLDVFRTAVFDEPAIAVRRVLQTGIDYEGELKFDDRNQTLGLRISLLCEKNALTSLAEPLGVAVYIRDLTRTKEFEKLKSDMISLMSHELRTPLTSINGFAELLTADEAIPEQAREFVTIIANESQRMSRMINTFLSVAQLQRKDKQGVLKIPLRLDEVVHDTVATLQTVAKKKRIRLVEQSIHRLPPVAADKSLIMQAVKNLVHNAIKYSPERTTVTVSTALEAETVKVSVEDRGYGIPSESKDRVWEKFYRVVRDGQEKDDESTGLGLSFVREVVEQHGGRVDLDSEEGRGSTFSFTLPRL